MNRRSFFQGLAGIGAAIAAVPALAKQKAAGRPTLLLPKNPAVGEYITIFYVGEGRWATIGSTRAGWVADAEVKEL